MNIKELIKMLAESNLSLDDLITELADTKFDWYHLTAEQKEEKQAEHTAYISELRQLVDNFINS